MTGTVTDDCNAQITAVGIDLFARRCIESGQFGRGCAVCHVSALFGSETAAEQAGVRTHIAVAGAKLRKGFLQ